MRGQTIVMRGHMVKSRKEWSSQMVSVGTQRSFDMHDVVRPQAYLFLANFSKMADLSGKRYAYS